MDNAVSNKRTKMIIGFLLLAVAVTVFFMMHSTMPRLALFIVFGLAIGVALERSRFCFVSAISNAVLMRDGRLLRGVVVGMIIAAVGIGIMMMQQVPDPDSGIIPVNAHVVPLGWSIAIGGLLFGVGSVIGGGCVIGSLSRLGEGSLSVIILTAGVEIGLILYNLHAGFWQNTVMHDAQRIWLPAKMGWPMALVVTIAGLLLVYYLIRIAEAGSVKKFFASYRPHIDFKSFTWKKLLEQWPATVGGIILGVISIFSYKFLERPLGVSGEYVRWSEIIGESIGLHFPEVDAVPGACAISASADEITWGLVLNLSILIGAMIVALISGDFSIKYPKTWRSAVRVLIGAVIMGYGIGLAGGCNIGAFFSAIISFGVNGWVFGLTVFIGSLIGIKILQVTQR
jgi:uncharacterized membrane protein YedE/YeeE